MMIIVQEYALKCPKGKIANEKTANRKERKNKAKEKTLTRQIAKSE